MSNEEMSIPVEEKSRKNCSVQIIVRRYLNINVDPFMMVSRTVSIKYNTLAGCTILLSSNFGNYGRNYFFQKPLGA